MSTLYLFNPENDLALACGKPNFTPPPMAQKIRHDLQMIPMWIMDSGFILADSSESNIAFLSNRKRLFPQLGRVHIYDEGEVVKNILPWGWSLAEYCELGRKFDKAMLPDIDYIHELRELSNRKLAIEVLRQMKDKYGIDELPRLCRSEQEVTKAVGQMGECMMKAPWSGSGKGVFKVNPQNFDIYFPWIKGILKRQQAIICEPFLRKVQDFAMEFYSDGERVNYIGLSVFSTNGRFAYENSLVGSECVLRQHLSDYIDADSYETLKSDIAECVSPILLSKGYAGYFGVDMMVYQTQQGELRICPCIELNLRMTMGLVASAFGNKFMEAGVVGEYFVVCHRTHGDLLDFVDRLRPPIVKNGKLQSGSLLLSPIYADSNYTATVTI